MKVKIDSFVTADSIKGATPDAPKTVSISKVVFIEAKDLPFKGEEGRYELTINLNDDELTWMPNKTSLRAIVAKYGDESNDWAGKEIGLYSLKQNVSGEIRDVIYATA